MGQRLKAERAVLWEVFLCAVFRVRSQEQQVPNYRAGVTKTPATFSNTWPGIWLSEPWRAGIQEKPPDFLACRALNRQQALDAHRAPNEYKSAFHKK